MLFSKGFSCDGTFRVFITIHCLQFQYYHCYVYTTRTVTPQQRTGDSVATQVARWSVSQLDKHDSVY